MKFRSLLSPDILHRTCFFLGVGILLVVLLLTLGIIGATLTGNIAHLELSRFIAQGYVIVSIGGEALAAAGFIAGAGALLRKQPISLGLAIGLAFNLLGLLLFLPATLALILNGLFSLLDYLLV